VDGVRSGSLKEIRCKPALLSAVWGKMARIAYWGTDRGNPGDIRLHGRGPVLRRIHGLDTTAKRAVAYRLLGYSDGRLLVGFAPPALCLVAPHSFVRAVRRSRSRGVPQHDGGRSSGLRRAGFSQVWPVLAGLSCVHLGLRFSSF
jgi:hypothetical protein